ncbi:hypothetical protein C8R43DRAFT_969621 [Mycena crocata]|nr:hypothetical protein C8R43DRAFT_969621 [Mycena crocata]
MKQFSSFDCQPLQVGRIQNSLLLLFLDLHSTFSQIFKQMSFYLGVLACSSILSAPFNRGSHNLTRLAAASSSIIAEPQSDSRWRNYDLAREPTDSDAAWRDYYPAVDSQHTGAPTQPLDNFPMRRPEYPELNHGHYHVRAHSGGHSYSSASPTSSPFAAFDHSAYHPPSAALATLLKEREAKRYDVENGNPYGFAGRVEEAARDSWAKAGLRVSPFRLHL